MEENEGKVLYTRQQRLVASVIIIFGPGIFIMLFSGNVPGQSVKVMIYLLPFHRTKMPIIFHAVNAEMKEKSDIGDIWEMAVLFFYIYIGIISNGSG